MSLSLVSLVVASIAVGGGIALQAAVNASLARRVGTFDATFISVTITWLFALVLVLINFRTTRLGLITTVPPYLLIGGFLGAAILITAITAVPKLGTAGLIASFIAGQLIMAMLLDHFGAFGLPHIPVTPIRIAGAALLLVGMRLILR